MLIYSSNLKYTYIDKYKLLQIRNKLSSHCIDALSDMTKFNEEVKTWPCHNQGGNQHWLMSDIGEIRRDETCVDYTGTGSVFTNVCDVNIGTQIWIYEKVRNNR